MTNQAVLADVYRLYTDRKTEQNTQGIGYEQDTQGIGYEQDTQGIGYEQDTQLGWMQAGYTDPSHFSYGQFLYVTKFIQP